MEYLKQISSAITSNDLPSITNLWEEYCLSDEIDPQELQLILEEIKQSHLIDSFGVYVDQVLPLWESLPQSEEKDEIFKLIIDIQTTNSPDLAEKVLLYLQGRFQGSEDEFANILRLIGLREKESFRGAVSHFELLNHLKKHNFVFHTGGWGVGEIMDISFIREEISLEFDYVAGLKDISFKNGFHTLIPLKNSHFLARRFGNPDDLEKDAKSDPVGVIRLLLKDLGPKTAAEIKDELCDLVIPEEEWAKWWSTARSKLKKDTKIESPKSLKQPFQLSRSEISHEERLQSILDKKPDADTLIDIIYSFMRDFPSAFKKAEFKATLVLQLAEIGKHEEITPSQEMQIFFFLEDLDDDEAQKKMIERIKGGTDFSPLILDIKVVAFKKRLLSAVKKHREDWDQIFYNCLLKLQHNPTRDYVLQQLIKSGKREEVSGKIEEMLTNPKGYSGTFLWYFSKVIEKSDLPFSDARGKEQFLENFFVLLYLLEQDKSLRDQCKKFHTFLTHSRYSVVRDIFETASLEVVKEVLLLASKCLTVDEHDRKILQSLAQVVHPSLASEDDQEELEEENHIWTTEAGYVKIKERIHQIATVETVQNAKEIEVARAHGDLRENAEFKFALEKKQQLQSEMKLLSDQLNLARILTADDINTAEIGIGTRVKLTDDKGSDHTFTFLGPWDASPDENILSFHSQFAQSLVGAKVGEARTVKSEKWTVKEIRSYLD